MTEKYKYNYALEIVERLRKHRKLLGTNGYICDGVNLDDVINFIDTDERVIKVYETQIEQLESHNKALIEIVNDLKLGRRE